MVAHFASQLVATPPPQVPAASSQQSAVTTVASAANVAGSQRVALSPCSARLCPLQKPHVESHCDAIGHPPPEQNSVAQLNIPVESIAAHRGCPRVSAQSSCGRASSATPSRSAPVQLPVARSSLRTARAATAGMARQRPAASSRTAARPGAMEG